jgi:L-ascorbate metabolism protein UlaG (beta-lactamase superfamily)
MELDGLSVCHLGDLGHTLNANQVEEIGKVDILMAPVGGGNTINAAQAAEIVRSIEPKVVIPMHYKTPAVTRELEPVEQFLKEMGVTQINPQPKLSINVSNLPLTTQVILLSY